jgi:Tol biopolymer transport system component
MRATLCAAGLCLAVLLSPAAGSARQATYNAGIAWSADGVYIAEADGSGARRVVPEVADQHFGPAWSPSGDELVFSARNSDSVDVYLVAAATGERRVLSLRGRWVSPRRGRVFSYLLEPTWAPDGRQIAFSDSWTPVSSKIRIASLGAGRLRTLTSPRRGSSDSSPAWSPHGRTIALVRQRPRASPAIMLVGADGRGLRRLTSGLSPSWSPDGRRLVFAWGDAIFRVDVDGSNRVRVARRLNARGADLQPRWSPDGRKILYLSPRGIWTMDTDGTNRARIVHGPLVSGADWRPG